MISTTPRKEASLSSSPLSSPSKVVIDIAQGPNGLLGTPAPQKTASTSSAVSSPLLRSNSGLAQPTFDVEEDKVSWSRKNLVDPFKRRIVTPALAILKSGATPEGLALSFAFGMTGGIFPVPATTTIICVTFAFIFKLNLAAVQLTNLLMTPINLGTFLTFIRFGEALFGAEPVALSLEPFKTAPLAALGTFWISLCYGVVAWSIFTPPATFLAYLILKPILRRAMSGMGNKSAAD